MTIKLFVQTTHTNINYLEATDHEITMSETILTTKFQAKDKSMSYNPMVRKGILSDVKSFYTKLDSGVNILPTGFLKYLLEYYEMENLECTVKDLRKFPTPSKDVLLRVAKEGYSTGNFIARDYQNEALKKIVVEKGGIIELPTGSGKTLIAYGITELYKKHNVLFVFDSLDLIIKTREDFIEYGCDENDIGIIDGSSVQDNKRITLLSMMSYEKAYHVLPKVNIIVSDECHVTGRVATAEKIFYSCQNAPMHVGLSATPFSDNPYETMKLYGLIGPIIYKKELVEQIDEDYLATINVKMIPYECDPIPVTGSWVDIYDIKKETKTRTKEKMEKEGYTITYEDGKYIGRKFLEFGDETTHYVTNMTRNGLIAYQVEKYKQEGKRVLILFNRIDHGMILHNAIGQSVLISGEDDIETRLGAKTHLMEKEGSVVIASKIWQKGINIKEIDVLIIAGAGVGTTKIIQQLGRATRKSDKTGKVSAIVIDLYDEFSALAKRQSDKRLSIYQNHLKLNVEFI